MRRDMHARTRACTHIIHRQTHRHTETETRRHADTETQRRTDTDTSARALALAHNSGETPSPPTIQRGLLSGRGPAPTEARLEPQSCRVSLQVGFKEDALKRIRDLGCFPGVPLNTKSSPMWPRLHWHRGAPQAPHLERSAGRALQPQDTRTPEWRRQGAEPWQRTSGLSRRDRCNQRPHGSEGRAWRGFLEKEQRSGDRGSEGVRQRGGEGERERGREGERR